MNFNKFLQSLFGNKSSRDMKLIQPIVEKVKAEYPNIKALSNDQLRAKTKEIQQYVQNAGKAQREKIAELKATIEDTPIDQREDIFNQIDKLEKEALDNYEVALNEVLPTAFSIVKDTARRFAENEETVVTATEFDRELAANPANDFITIDGDNAIYHNHWTAGGNDLKWEMVHYDVQLFGGTVLHQGKIAEMATGEGKTLVATLPVFLNALTGNGVHVVTVNDYLAKRDSEWMGPLYMFNGLSVDCIDKHRPNSDARRKAYMADITFGTNNEFGFDYLRDNMATSPADLVQRQHNYAIVDEVDSVLIDDARTPLIISGPIPKGDDQMFEQYQPLVERLYEVQRKQATELLAEAKQKIGEGTKNKDAKMLEDGFLALYRSYKALPKNKPLIKYLSEEGIKAGMLKTEEYYMANNNREMPKAVAPLYFVVDEKLNSADLTDKGTEWLAKQVNDRELFVLPDIATEMSQLEARTDISDQERLDIKDEMMAHYGVQSERVHTLQQLLKAYTMFNKDDEYVVMDGEVKIVDEQTGRIMEGRRWSDGLHQAIEAKEHVKVEAATQTFATITLQNYFRLYDKLSGMTGTALTEDAEFREIYKLPVEVIPSNKPVQRVDHEDLVYRTIQAKYNAVADDVERRHAKGQPVLVGTVSIESSEKLSAALTKRGIAHEVLNAKHHEREAHIVAQAGRYGAVTIATNMAGRGTDILLGGNPDELVRERLEYEGLTMEDVTPEQLEQFNAEAKETCKAERERVLAAGGLTVIGTERHESRRIDNQLRGRSGRQGDPGETQFYLSLEDDLMRLFGGDKMDRVSKMMVTADMGDDMPIQHKIISKAVESAQHKVESINFSMRKSVLEYDDVMNKQRQVIYAERNKILDGKDLTDHITEVMHDTVYRCVQEFCTKDSHDGERDLEGLRKWVVELTGHIDTPKFPDEDFEALAADVLAYVEKCYNMKAERLGEDLMRELNTQVMLRVIDTRWMNYLQEMDYLKTGIGLRGFGQRDPLVEYKTEAYGAFQMLVDTMYEDYLRTVLRIEIKAAPQAVEHKEDPALEGARFSGPADVDGDNGSSVLRKQAQVQARTAVQGGPAAVNNGGKVTTYRKSESDDPYVNVGRNDLCPCGSGKKFKYCHGRNR